MKKILILIFGIAIILTGCGNKEANMEEKEITQEVIEEMGEGNFYLQNESGTTEDNKHLMIFDDGETLIMQIGIVTENIDGSKLTYVYENGELLTKEQYGNSQGSLDLKEKNLTVGNHQIVLKQFDNDSEDGTPTMIKMATYEVKEK